MDEYDGRRGIELWAFPTKRCHSSFLRNINDREQQYPSYSGRWIALGSFTTREMDCRIHEITGISKGRSQGWTGDLGEIGHFDHSERITPVLVIMGINLHICFCRLVVYRFPPGAERPLRCQPIRTPTSTTPISPTPPAKTCSRLLMRVFIALP